MSYFRHSIAGNASTIVIRTIHLLLAIPPTWNSTFQKKDDRQAIRVRDDTNAYLQSDPKVRLLFL